MAIRASFSKHTEVLIADLAGPDEVRREAAIARLIVIGDRAVERLIAAAEAARSVDVRTAALRALEGIGSERSVAMALRWVDDPDPSTARAAISLARLFLKTSKGPEVVDRLTAVALDAQRPDAVRVAAVAVLRELEAKTVRPLLKTLAADSRVALRAAARSPAPPPLPADTAPPEAPDGVREWLAREGAKAPLSSVLGIVERVREREASEAPSRRPAWTAVRFAAHLVLARRRSRVAVYDLRESFERTPGPLPADALTALTLVGDASCLEAIASAHARSNDARWRSDLLETFHGIVKREKLGPRNAALKKIRKKFGWAGQAGKAG